MLESQVSLTPYLLHCLQLSQEHQKLCLVAENNHQANWLYELLKQNRSDLLLFPDWEILPYDTLSPAADIAAERARTLYRMMSQKSFVVITSAHAIAYRLPEPSFYHLSCLSFHVGQLLDRSSFIKILTDNGYGRTEEVLEPMDFALRGAIIDFYPPFLKQPLRLEWDLERLGHLRFFDPATQRSTEQLSHFEFFPSFEYPIDSASLRACEARATALWGAKNPIARQLRQDKIPAGFLFLSPLWLQGQPHSFYDYLPQDCAMSHHPLVASSLAELQKQAEKAYQECAYRYGFQPFPPSEILADLTPWCHHNIAPAESKLWDPIPAPKTSSWEALKKELAQSKKRWVFTFESYSRSQILCPKVQALIGKPLQEEKSLQKALISQAPYTYTLAPLQEAVAHKTDQLVIIPEAWLYQETVRPRSLRATPARPRVTGPSLELALGSLVIHRNHGLARYHGLKTLQFENFEQELIELEFDQNQKLYVPLDDIAFLTPYYALEQQKVELALLGSSRWKKQLQSAQKAIEDQAAALLAIHATRASAQGEALALPADYFEFAATFPFEETPDQKQAIDDVLADLQSPVPMDRLVCGDVGFGKTEVALRAIFTALSAGYQVAFLSPTTLLSQQHYETLLERFEQWPFRITLLTRHTSSAQAVLEKLRHGAIDCVVGTHKLLQPQVTFKRLGLVVVDEEHRFGVRHKEALKKWRGSVNILTLTATPIPRTLSMSFQGLRDLSLIASPPSQRRSIQTVVASYDISLVEQAITRELFRGGQVYYLCNDIERHLAVVTKLASLFPGARIESLHGRLSEREMESRMSQFYHQRVDILVGTTIIETGIDVPGANTIIIENAHCFGLAQLHQIRGRVGRSHQQAYAYLLIPMPIEYLPNIARSRLELLTQYQDLGSGFQLATHDLEIRGAGEILGEKQSGHILDLGIDLYRQMLSEACRTLEHAEKSPAPATCHYQLSRPFSIDPEQIPDAGLRLRLYHRFDSLEHIDAWRQECCNFEDRFGIMTQRTQEWAQSHRFRLLAQSWSWKELTWRKSQPLNMALPPRGTPGACSERAIEQFVQDHARFIMIKGPRTLALQIPKQHEHEIAQICTRLFDRLENEVLTPSPLLWET